MTNDTIRQLFDEHVYPNSDFPLNRDGLDRYPQNRRGAGEYLNLKLEDHWQTFQQGFELAVKECALQMRKTAEQDYETGSEVSNVLIEESDWILKKFNVN